MELQKDKTKRILGRKPQTCRICGAKGEFETYLAREMMQGTREEFLYFSCADCECLQIAQIPTNLGDYYGSGYYSFQMPEEADMKFEVPVSHREKILDVGCGGGRWLVQKAMEGWGNLYGCDPFLEKSRHYGDRVKIYNCSIHEMEGDGTFDIIRMSDSFEHMADPLETLKSVGRLLRQGGILYMTIPTYPNVAFDEFGPHWYQLDAPRHLFLHSKKSLQWLADKSGLTLSKMQYNSNNNQMIRSYFYQHGIPFYEQQKLMHRYFSSALIWRLQEKAEEWNKKECGDHMQVYWQKGSMSDGGEDYLAEMVARKQQPLTEEKTFSIILLDGMMGEKSVYEDFCKKLTRSEWEKWSALILDAVTAGLAEDRIYKRQLERLPKVLSYMSVSSVVAWVERSENTRIGKIGERLQRYASECAGRIGNTNNIQELCLCASLLKEAYIQVRKEPDSIRIFYMYVALMGAFAERYYHPECLKDAENRAVPSDVMAVWRMALALSDGTKSSENVVLLKQALAAFPPFHEEIKNILMQLK